MQFCISFFTYNARHFMLCISIYASYHVHFSICAFIISLYVPKSMHIVCIISFYTYHSRHFILCISSYIFFTDLCIPFYILYSLCSVLYLSPITSCLKLHPMTDIVFLTHNPFLGPEIVNMG